MIYMTSDLTWPKPDSNKYRGFSSDQHTFDDKIQYLRLVPCPLIVKDQGGYLRILHKDILEY